MWMYPPLVEAGLLEVETYAARCQNAFSQYTVTRPMMYLCLEAER